MSRVKFADKIVYFCFPSQKFFEFWANYFQTFGQKTPKSSPKYLLRVQWNSLWLEFFFLKFWIVLDFVQKTSVWFSKLYLAVQSKNCGKNSFFFISFQSLFELWAKTFQTFGQNTSTCPQEQLVALKLFKKFWTVLDFLQKPLVWVSLIYLSVQSKNCGRNIFLFSFSEFFRILSKLFSDFWPKNFKNLSKLPSTCPEEQFVAWFFLSFETFQIFCRNIWHSFLSRFFSNFEQKFFGLLAKKLQKVFKTTYVSRRIACGLKFFSKVLNRFGFSAETFGMVLKILSTCPE